MIKAWLTYLFSLLDNRKVFCIYACKKDSGTVYHWGVCNQKKGTWQVLVSGVSPSLADALEAAPKEARVVICLDGGFVLAKPGHIETKNTAMFAQHYDTEAQAKTVIGKTADIDKIIEACLEAGLKPTEVLLGAKDRLIGLLLEDTLDLSDSKSVIAHVMKLVYSDPQAFGIYKKVVEHRAEDEFQSKTIVYGKLIAAAFLLVFGLNSYVNFSAFDKNQDLRGQVYKLDAGYAKTAQLAKQSAVESEFLSSLNWPENTQFAFLLDRLAASRTAAIHWTDLQVFPLKKTTSNAPFLNNDTIIIQGVCKQAEDLNDWIDKVRGLDFVESLSASDYRYDARKRRAVFELTIKLNKVQ